MESPDTGRPSVADVRSPVCCWTKATEGQPPLHFTEDGNMSLASDLAERKSRAMCAKSKSSRILTRRAGISPRFPPRSTDAEEAITAANRTYSVHGRGTDTRGTQARSGRARVEQVSAQRGSEQTS